MPTLAEQIRSQGGDWMVAGIDRAAELAELLRRAGVTTLQPILKVSTMGTVRPGGRWTDSIGSGDNYQEAVWIPDPSYSYTQELRRLKIGGVTVGFAGDANNDGSYSNSSSVLKPGDMVAWSARGDGNVAYHAATGPDGKVRIFPSHGSSSDFTRSLKNFLTAVAVIAGGVMLVGAVAPGLAGAAGAEAAAGAVGASGATNAALIESALQTAGYGASSAGLGGGAGVLAGAGATNAALIESALETAGYGASSAGAGGAAAAAAAAAPALPVGLSDVLSEAGTLLQNTAGQVLEQTAGKVLDAAIGAVLPAILPGPPGADPLTVTPGSSTPRSAAENTIPPALLWGAAALLVALVL